MAQYLGALASPPENLGSVPSTHMAAYKHPLLQFLGDAVPSSSPCKPQTHTVHIQVNYSYLF